MSVKAIKVVEIETLDARSLMNEVRLFARRRHVILTQPVWSRRSIAIDPNFIFFAGSDEARGCLQSICRDDLNIMYDVIAKECKASGIMLIRGDMTDEQQIVLSIWEEIGRATHIIVDLTGFNLNVCLKLGIANALGRNTFIIGQQGTEGKLFRSIEKRRCHPYPSNPVSDPNFMKALRNFLSF